MFLRSWIRCLLVFWLSLLVISSQAGTIKVAIHQKDLEGYQQLMRDQSCADISDYSVLKGQHSSFYLTLICQALFRSQFETTFQLIATPNYRRSIWQIVQGHADIAANVYMSNQYVSPMLEAGAASFSIPIIRAGEQVAAFYALPSNEKAMAVTNLEELQQLTVAIPSSWRQVHETFSKHLQMNVENVKSEHLFEFIQSGRADFTALRLQGDRADGYKIVRNGITLTPIVGIKALMNHANHFIVGRNQPHSEAFFQALQKGLRLMRKDGTLVKALRQAGMLSDETLEWNSVYDISSDITK